MKNIIDKLNYAYLILQSYNNTNVKRKKQFSVLH